MIKKLYSYNHIFGAMHHVGCMAALNPTWFRGGVVSPSLKLRRTNGGTIASPERVQRVEGENYDSAVIDRFRRGFGELKRVFEDDSVEFDLYLLKDN